MASEAPASHVSYDVEVGEWQRVIVKVQVELRAEKLWRSRRRVEGWVGWGS